MEIFNECLNRLNLLKIKPNPNNKKIKIAIYRNHSFEMVGSVLNAFLDFSSLGAEFIYSDYDDSLSFTNVPYDVDLFIIWLDVTRYNNINIKMWIKDRICALKSITNKKIILYSTDEIDFSDINIPDTLIINSNKIKDFLGKYYLDIEKEKYSGTRYSNKTCLYIARELGLIYIPSLLLPKLKAIVLDLDNTLYDGVLGEDGIYGIKPFYELQNYLKHLKDNGILLAILSKNEFQDVKKMFELRDDLPLKISDFSTIEANWNSKSDNILKIVKTLNIGMDSILYIDDNIGELESVKFNFPMIKIIEAKSSKITLNTLKFYPCLFNFNKTEEDNLRTKDIQANIERSQMTNNLSTDEYFKKLEITLTYDLEPKNSIDRIVELLNKTNQFIFNYARYNLSQINEIFNSKNSCVITVSMSDKLSNSGIIGILIGHKENNICLIDELTVSCRALGRNIEDILISNLLYFACTKLSLSKISLKYKKGDRNAPALNWLSKFANQEIDSEFGSIFFEKITPLVNDYINIEVKKGVF